MSAAPGSEAAPLRLDLRVMQQEEVTRSAAQSLISGGHVRVNNREARSGQRVRPGDDVVVVTPPPAAAAVDGPRESWICTSDSRSMILDERWNRVGQSFVCAGCGGRSVSGS